MKIPNGSWVTGVYYNKKRDRYYIIEYRGVGISGNRKGDYYNVVHLDIDDNVTWYPLHTFGPSEKLSYEPTEKELQDVVKVIMNS
jgi:hypothetical protein